MTRQEIRDEIIRRVARQLGNSYKVTLHEVTKNNNVRLEGLLISRTGTNLSPTIYLENYYRNIECGCLIEDAVEDIISIAKSDKHPKNIDVKNCFSFQKQKDNVRMKVISFSANEKGLLEDVPYIPFLDLAIVFYLDLSKEMPDSTVLIKDAMLELWGISVEELYKLAKENSKKEEYEIRSMMDVLVDMTDCSNAEELFEGLAITEDTVPMFVMSNKKKLFGAAAILNIDSLNKFANRVNSDLYIIPSSVHEIIIIPASRAGADVEDTDEYFNSMIREVNETQLAADEVLSNHYYFYCKATNKITF